MRGLKTLFCASVLLFTVSCAGNFSSKESPLSDGTTSEEENKSYDILFIGNSFTFYNSLDVITQKIAENIGIDMKCKALTLGSHSLLEDADENDSLGKKIDADLKKHQYTDIILQDKSNYPYNHYSEFREGVSLMSEKIKSLQEHANTYLYETWGYNSENITTPIPEMEDTIRYNTNMVAKRYELTPIYVGEAFTYIYENYPDLNLYHQDNKHPSYLGSYLAALVHVATITGKHVTNVTYQGEYGVTNDYGQVTFVSEVTKEILINTAERVVFQEQ